MDQQETLVYNVPQDDVNPEYSTESERLIQIKQELNDANVIDTNASAVVDSESIQVSIDEFVSFHNEQIKILKNDIVYLTRGFDIMYKCMTVLDWIIEEYFKDDKLFKYGSIVDFLNTEIMTFIAEDEERYQNLVSEINIDTIMNEDNQLEFHESDGLNDFEDEVMNNVNDSGPLAIRKLPGQKSAPLPECPACEFKARCRNKLEAHITEHKDNPIVVCNRDNCSIKFQLSNLTQHEKDHHPETNLICEMCNDMFDNKSTLVQHYKLHISKKDRLKCNFPGCDYTDIYPGRMDRHKKAEHNIEITKQFKCDHEGCGRVFKDRPSFYTHSLIHKDRSLVYKHKCTHENCGAVFKRRRNLALHMLKHGYIKRKYTCMFGECRRTYNREKELMKHIDQFHQNLGDSKTEFKENGLSENENDHEKSDTESRMTTRRSKKRKILNENYTSKEEEEEDDDERESASAKKLFQLMNKSDSNRPNSDVGDSASGNEDDGTADFETVGTECELCQTNFDSSEELLNHLKERHHQYTIKAYQCDFEGCQYVTHFRSILGKHKNEVHGGKYKCDVCGKLSKDSGNHNRHRNIHKNILYRCRVADCNAVYKSPKAYYVHVLTHSNEQPVYRCDHPGCKYITYYVNTLNVHKLTHSDVRNFFCPYENCRKGFKRNGDLNKHIIHSHKGVKRPQKKRRNQDIQSLHTCRVDGCGFSVEDIDQLTKHEEGHMAAESVENYDN
ncbi:Zinc finger protein 91 [Sarcoptes scabiei]|uniref:Zinc finger protein 91 n=1 Tax=Sarcoptes scabiei TaxID=52283 RepID=A0A132A8C5_SARSC|nr:Zinc finger protein 91 [Sarcoptes scabiei]KPM07222.1 hypothetical protein QR98_0057100 [Sarcoptes scabiei]